MVTAFASVALCCRAPLRWQKRLCDGSVEELGKIIIAFFIGLTDQTLQKALEGGEVY